MVTKEQRSLRQEIEDIEQIEEYELDEDNYDTTPSSGIDGLYGLELNDGLTDEEIRLAPMYAMFRAGLLIVTGTPGAGKGVFSNSLAWYTRRLFKNRKVFLDYQPKISFDYGFEKNPYFLQTWEYLQTQIKAMAIQSGTVKLSFENPKDKTKKDEEQELKGDLKEEYIVAMNTWKQANEVKMRNCIMNLDEYKRYLYNRQPTAKINKTYGMINSWWRHLNMLILGMCPNINEIDVNNALFYMTHHVKCSWSQERKDTTKAKFYRKKSISANGVVNVEKKPFVINVDGRKPRPEIEVELIRPDLASGDPERRIVNYLLSTRDAVRDGHICKVSNLNRISIATGEELNECKQRLLNMHGDWIENENLEVSFTNAIRCKGIYDIYNSQNFANMNITKGNIGA
jgi:hypothetical protein